MINPFVANMKVINFVHTISKTYLFDKHKNQEQNSIYTC